MDVLKGRKIWGFHNKKLKYCLLQEMGDQIDFPRNGRPDRFFIVSPTEVGVGGLQEMGESCIEKHRNDRVVKVGDHNLQLKWMLSWVTSSEKIEKENYL